MNRNCLLLPAVAVAILLLSACETRSAKEGVRIAGLDTKFGSGNVSTYAEIGDGGIPLALGITFKDEFLNGPPPGMTDGLKCFDRNDNGAIEEMDECIPSHEKVIPLPDAVASRADMPFKWILLDWNPMGHPPSGVYSVPHYDVHYMIDPVEQIFSIVSGPCGEGVRCDLLARAKKPLPEGFMHPDFRDVDAVVPGMGNHLIDVTSHEFHGSAFTRTWIYGAFDGRVTFYEEMVSRDFLTSKPSECFPIKSPAEVGVSGYYPTLSCIRYNADTGAYTISIEGFQSREASGPKSIAAL